MRNIEQGMKETQGEKKVSRQSCTRPKQENNFCTKNLKEKKIMATQPRAGRKWFKPDRSIC